MARRPAGRRPRPSSNRTYPRTARLNALLRQIVADHFERAEDEEIGFMTITGVEVDADLNVCQVYVSTFSDPEDDERILDALAAHRKAIQAEIGSQAKMRKTPNVQFAFDPGVREGIKIDEILSHLNHPVVDSKPPTEPASEAD